MKKNVLMKLAAGIIVVTMGITGCGSSSSGSSAESADKTTSSVETTTSSVSNDADTSVSSDGELNTKDENGETYKIGFALQTEDVQVFSTMSDGMQARADELGVDYTCLVANGDAATQISNIENMIAQGYDAIIVHAFDKEAFGDVVKEAMDKGIVICAYDDDIIDSSTGEKIDYPFSYLCDNYEIGHRVGTMAANWTKAHFTDESATLQFGLMQHKEYEIHQERVQGMKDAIAEIDPRIEIVDEQEGLVTEDGVKACEAWSQAYPDLVGVVSTNDTTLLGYSEAWKALGKDVADPDFGMFGNDGVYDAITMVANGEIIRGDVGLDVYKGGGDALEECVKVLNGATPEDVIMPMVDVTEDNASVWTDDPNLYR